VTRPLQVVSVMLGLGAAAISMAVMPAVASATPEFPDAIASFVGADIAPECTICHDNPNGGRGTVTTVFGSYMRSRGLSAYDDASLETALQAAQGERHDSDGDGITDVDALAQGLDPNGENAGPAASYGCAVSPAQGASGGLDSQAWVWLGLLAFVFWRSRVRGRAACE